MSNALMENSLWSMLRTIVEIMLLLRHMAHHAHHQQDTQVPEVAELNACDAEQSTQPTRDLVRRQETFSEDWLHHDPG